MLNEETGLVARDAKDRAAPIYERMKTQIRARIETGEWPVNHRIPSENELVETLGVSRMTANRALRELANEGVITRVQGRGSFVAPKKRSAPALGVRNIADEISARGHQHKGVLQRLERFKPDAALLRQFELEGPQGLFHSVVVHHENDVAI